MNINVGIVAEYNPFHNGHALQIRKIKELFGEECTITVVMSGDYVQRGEPAVFSKFARAEAACRCGADLVAELPVQWCEASAGRFAQGAVSILSELGITHLAFGSESGDINLLKETAGSISGEDFAEKVKSIMIRKKELSYPAAREAAIGNESIKTVLHSPNDCLGLEYIRCLNIIEKNTGKLIEPVAIKREGAAHDEGVLQTEGNNNGSIPDESDSLISESGLLREKKGRIASASCLRSGIRENGVNAIEEFVPPEAISVYKREIEAGRGPVYTDSLEKPILSRLMLFGREYFNSLPDGGDGAGDRLTDAVRESYGYSDMIAKSRTKRFTHSRMRRLSMQACLGISEKYASDIVAIPYKEGESVTRQKEGTLPPYIRILAFNEKGRDVIAKSKKNARIHVISRGKDSRKDAYENEVFALCASAHDFYMLAYSTDNRIRKGEDYRFCPIVVQNDENT